MESGEEIRVEDYELLVMLDENPTVTCRIMTNLDTEISASLMQTRQKLSIVWLAGGSATSSTAWGEPGNKCMNGRGEWI